MTTRAPTVAMVALALASAGACPTDDGPPPPPPPPPEDAGPGDDCAEPTESGFVASLDGVEDVAALDNELGAVKFLLPVAGAPPRLPLCDTCAFQDTAAQPFHIPFLNSLPGGDDIGFDDYIALVLRRDGRAWWGGEVAYHVDVEHPLTGVPGVLAYALYTEDSPGNRLIIDDVRAVFDALVTCAPAFADALVFVPTNAEQRQTALLIQGELADEGIAVDVDGF